MEAGQKSVSAVDAQSMHTTRPTTYNARLSGFPREGACERWAGDAGCNRAPEK